MRRKLAYALFLVAALVAFVAVGAIAYDVMVPIRPGGTNLQRQGARGGSVIGIVFRTAVLAGVAIGLWVLGLRNYDPAKYSADAVDRRRLVAIASKQKEFNFDKKPSEAAEFLKYSDNELVDIYGHMDRAKHVARFHALTWVICQRCAEDT